MNMKKYKLLKQGIISICLVLIALFSIRVEAANFAYADFDWDKFYDENIDYWTDYCTHNSGNMSVKECVEIVLSGKKEYYVKLYKLLAKYERKGFKLNDNIVLATSFFDLTPDTFTELPEEYKKEYMDGSAYNIDTEEDIDSYDVDTDESIEYYQNEKDSLKILLKHMFSYKAVCNGNAGTPSVDSNGNKYCASGTLDGDTCSSVIKTYDLNYSEYLISKLGFIGRLFGLKDKNRDDCLNNGGVSYKVINGKQINYDIYWKFLTESTYFDTKKHLTNRYKKILEKTNHSRMTELSESEYEANEADIIKVRERIVKEIKSILEDYEDYMANTPDSYSSSCTGGSLWWPIGGDTTTNEGNAIFAKDAPSNLNINSPYGNRKHPITGEMKNHTGVDLAGTENVSNVIAVKDGVVVYPTSSDPTNCPSSTSLDNCGGGYGNYVVIQHNDGTYTLYAHMYASSITVKEGDSVKQGQVIGKVGSSGNSTGAHLHFEVRQGTNSSSSSVDPMTILSSENPRTMSGVCGGTASSDFITFLHSWENGNAAPERDGKYVVHDDGAGIPTVGYGVALKYNIERFRQKGIDVTGMTFGDTIDKSIVDAVENEEINEAFNNVRNKLSENNITLAEYQIEALVSRYYNCGNINNFPSMYLNYGDTDALYDNYMSKPVTGQGVGYLSGLERRRKAEWQLFHYHNYELNS